jgi:hypothetical protein
MPRYRFNVNKSLQELEGSAWGKANREDTGLIKNCLRLRRVPLKDFTVADLRLMIGQQIGLEFLVPLALEHLERDPLIEGSLYPCDLLVNVLTVDVGFWPSHPELRLRAAQAAGSAVQMFPSRPEIATKTVTRAVNRAFAEFQSQSGNCLPPPTAKA